MWLVLALKKEVGVEVWGRETTLPFSQIADGCKGVLLVFDKKEDAVEYAPSGCDIIEIDFK